MAYALTCEYTPCGTEFSAPRKRMYCAPLCERRAYTARRTADGRLAAMRVQQRAYNAAYQKANADRWKVERKCLVCGAAWMTMRRDAKYCSSSCLSAAYTGQQNAPSRRALAQRRLQRAARGVRGEGVWADAACMHCGARYVVRVRGGAAAAHCSRACYDRTKGAVRRARERAVEREPIYRARVFQRDDWRCHLCGEDIDRSAVAPAPLAPTLDHVIPIARGGGHTMTNIKAAHFICNSTKSDRLQWSPAV